MLEVYHWWSNQIPATAIIPHSSIYDFCKYSLDKPNTCELSVRSTEGTTSGKSIHQHINKVIEDHLCNRDATQSTAWSHGWPLIILWNHTSVERHGFSFWLLGFLTTLWDIIMCVSQAWNGKPLPLYTTSRQQTSPVLVDGDMTNIYSCFCSVLVSSSPY